MKPFHACIRSIALLVLLTVVLVPLASAQTSSPDISGFVMGNVGLLQPIPSALTSIASQTNGGDRNEVRQHATIKRSPFFDLGGGVVIRDRWIVAGFFDRSAAATPAAVIVTLDHPAFHPTLTATRETEPLDRVETGLHFNAGYRFPVSSALSLSVFGGPSYLTRRQELLDDIDVSEPFNPATRTYSAIINSFETATVRSSSWGYNVGADASYFVSRHVGIGAQLRYTRATFETDNALQSDADERTVTDLIDAGGLRFSTGVRLRF